MRQATTQQPWNQAIAGGSYSRLRWIFMCCCNLQQNIERFVITRKEQEETTASSDCRRSVLHRRLSTGRRGLGWLHEHNIDAAKQVWFSVRELKNIVRRTKVMFVHAKNTILWADETPVPWKYSLPASMSSLWMCYCLCLWCSEAGFGRASPG